MKRLLLTLILAGIVAGPVLAFPGHRGPGGHEDGPMMDGIGIARHLERVADEIGLSDDQQAAIDAVVDESRDAFRDLRRAMHDNRDALREAMQADEYDAAAIQTLANQHGDLAAQHIVLRADVANRIHSVLTDAQRDQLRDLRQDRRRGR